MGIVGINKLNNKYQKCQSCKKEFTIKTLSKYGGVCGRCKKLLSEKEHEAKGRKVFFISLLSGFILGWLLLQLIPSIIPKSPEYLYFGDRDFADNEFASLSEKDLYIKMMALEEDSLKKQSLKKLISVNPYKPIYQQMLTRISAGKEPLANKTFQKPEKKIYVTPDLIIEFQSWKFYKRHGFNLSNKWELSSQYHGPGFHMNFSYNGSNDLGMEVQIKDNDYLKGLSIANTSVDIGIELAQIFYKDIDVNKFKEYLQNNLNKNINQIKESVPFTINNDTIHAGRVGWGNTLKFSFNPHLDRLPKEYELGKADSYNLIKNIVNKSFIDKLDSHIKKESINKKYPLLASYTESFNILPKTDVFLFYDGLPDGPIYDKPGAKNFGANELGRVSFKSGSVKAKVIAHKELQGNRNYFYVITRNLQGWMGRPYIMKNKAGDEFFMPNPLTGESVRKELKVSARAVKKVFKSEYKSFIPSYESITWDYRIPEQYRREGYEMYTSALQEGYRNHEALVNSYLSGSW